MTFSQELDPPGDGVVGTARFAILSVEAALDPPAGTDTECRIDPDGAPAADSDGGVPTVLVALLPSWDSHS